MTVAVKPPKAVTPDEYMETERAALQKSEYYAGEVVLMASASPNHNRIVGLDVELLFASIGIAIPLTRIYERVDWLID